MKHSVKVPLVSVVRFIYLAQPIYAEKMEGRSVWEGAGPSQEAPKVIRGGC